MVTDKDIRKLVEKHLPSDTCAMKQMSVNYYRNKMAEGIRKLADEVYLGLCQDLGLSSTLNGSKNQQTEQRSATSVTS